MFCPAKLANNEYNHKHANLQQFLRITLSSYHALILPPR